MRVVWEGSALGGFVEGAAVGVGLYRTGQKNSFGEMGARPGERGGGLAVTSGRRRAGRSG